MGLRVRNVVKLGCDDGCTTINIIKLNELKYKIIKNHVLKNMRRQSFIMPVTTIHCTDILVGMDNEWGNLSH